MKKAKNHERMKDRTNRGQASKRSKDGKGGQSGGGNFSHVVVTTKGLGLDYRMKDRTQLDDARRQVVLAAQWLSDVGPGGFPLPDGVRMVLAFTALTRAEEALR